MRLGIGPGVAIACALLLASFQASGVEPYTEYDKRVESNKNMTALTDNLFGESVSLYDGATEFTETDIDLPGNNALPVQLNRRLAIDITPVPLQGVGGYNAHLAGAGSWDVDVPYISGTYVTSAGWDADRCTVGRPPVATGFETFDFWHGNQVHIPGKGDANLLKVEAGMTSLPADSKDYHWTTRARDMVSCIPMQSGLAGEGFLLQTTSGDSYYFDVAVSRLVGYMTRSYYDWVKENTITQQLSRVKYYLLASKIVDRFGNTVQYQYDPLGHPVRIWSSDGREIQLSYQDGRLQHATANARQWNYAYGSGAQADWLSGVELPDHSRWSYSATGTLYPDEIETTGKTNADCSAKPAKVPANFGLTVVHPSGATGTFTFFNTRHYRSGLHASECLPRTLIQNGTVTPYWVLHTPYYFDVMSLMAKTISGPGQQDRTWTYDYGIATQSLWGNYSQPAAYPCTTCDQEKTVTVVNPDSTVATHRFGILYAANEGRLLGSSVLDANGVVLQTQATTYMSDAQSVGQKFPDRYGTIVNGDDPSTARIRPVIAQQTIRDGATYAWSVPATCDGSRFCFDAYGNPSVTVKSSNVGPGYSRTEKTEYFNQTVSWVLGQVARVTCMASTPSNTACDGGSDSIESETGFDPTYAVPLTNLVFGKLRQALGYTFTAGTQDGTLHTVTDGNGHVTTLANWYRGVPKTITYADGKKMSATVDDNGWMTSVVDENGYSTGYGYDPMGRMASIAYPTGDSTAWNSTTILYQSMATAEYGVPGGHWKRTESTGNSRKITYFDGMWRPVVEEQYDAANAGGTRSIVVKRYDLSGMQSFQSYPVASLGDWLDPALVGIKSTYDALGRVRASIQDSELGQLTTTTAYLTGTDGPYTQVTNPRGNWTRISYQSYDRPGDESPVSIREGNGNVVTTIVRDPFGKPISITRGNADGTVSEVRGYSYNGNQELCRTVDPETGATLMGYDLAGNLAWSAAGLPGATACNAQGDTATILARKAARSYDARNRLLHLDFPDGRGDQDWVYWPDGLPKSIATFNGSAGALKVINAYTYNRRRLLIGESSQRTGASASSIGYGYDANGALSSQVWPDGTTAQYQPNALGQASKVDTGGNAYASNATYYPNGALKSFTYGNGIVHTMAQNLRQLPDTSTDAFGGTRFISDGYDYDAGGNVAAITDGATGRNQRGNRTMVYDELDRLSKATSPMFGNGTTGTAQFDYDALNNLARVIMPATATSQGRNWYYCYDASWRLTNVKTGSCNGASVGAMGYDVQGNVNNKDGTGFDFDYGNRLRSASYNASSVESYQYDGYGRRVLSTAPAGTILSVYAIGGQLLYQDNARTGKQTKYFYLAGSLVNEVDRDVASGAISNRFQHTDALGSPVAETNDSRVVLSRTEYEPYGRVLAGGVPDRPGYTGHVADAQTGMDYMQQRYYDPMIGRFLSVDPVTATNIGGNFNRYWYANDNPYKFVDPDGRDALWVSHTDGTSTLVIKVLATGAESSNAQMHQIESAVESIQLQRADTNIDVQIVDKNGRGVNKLDFSPGNGKCPNEGCVYKLGGNSGHVDSTQSDIVNIAKHEILHFAGIDDQYIEGPRDVNGKRTAVPKPGYDRSNVMTDRSGNTLKNEQLDEAKSNKSTKKVDEK